MFRTNRLNKLYKFLHGMLSHDYMATCRDSRLNCSDDGLCILYWPDERNKDGCIQDEFFFSRILEPLSHFRMISLSQKSQ